MARARVFTKNTVNYLSLGNSGLGALLSGKAAFSVSARIRITSTTGGVNDNNILTAIINGTSAGMVFAVDGTGPKVRMRCRSVNTDGLQNLGATSILSMGVDYFVGAVYNIGAKTFAIYLNGIADGSAAGLTFGNPTWTLGAPTDNDAVGGFRAPPVATTDQFDGEISQVGLWSTALAVGNFASIAAGADPTTVVPGNLIWYLPITGLASPELPTVGASPQGTITGSLPPIGFDPFWAQIANGQIGQSFGVSL